MGLALAVVRVLTQDDDAHGRERRGVKGIEDLGSRRKDAVATLLLHEEGLELRHVRLSKGILQLSQP